MIWQITHLTWNDAYWYNNKYLFQNTLLETKVLYPICQNNHQLVCCQLQLNLQCFYKHKKYLITHKNGNKYCFITARLQSTFETLGFIVERCDNQDNSEMMRKLMTVALEDHSNYDCFVCCILSHGERDCVYGSNGIAEKISSLMRNLQACSCPSLAGKPKLFFVQACQGPDRMGMFRAQRDVSSVSDEELSAVSSN